ncbi:GNAT family N-acetyltransferase [Lentibacillus sp. Marseille-P4043]|uniref:GNAT family N-acetyltransferase n=1 Tax=Lentibacillus sp. Marseille-P4043 TaxID=2040293 RepID=UPI000D0BAA3B|nr:GNAT family N-acetyltransferase [Lentibacillus sp. Marseille-P4043]
MTQEIQLRALEKDDLAFLHKLFNNPDIMNFWFSESYMSLELMKEKFDKNKDVEQTREFILTTQDQVKLGFVGLYEIEQRHRNAEFAIMIDPAHQGKGYAATATELAMDYAFSVLNLHKLYLIVAKANEKASHIYEKVGFQTEGVMTEHFYINGEYHDCIMMSVFQRDYWKMKS